MTADGIIIKDCTIAILSAVIFLTVGIYGGVKKKKILVAVAISSGAFLLLELLLFIFGLQIIPTYKAAIHIVLSFINLFLFIVYLIEARKTKTFKIFGVCMAVILFVVTVISILLTFLVDMPVICKEIDGKGYIGICNGIPSIGETYVYLYMNRGSILCDSHCNMIEFHGVFLGGISALSDNEPFEVIKLS